MAKILAERMSAQIEGDFVVFLIGMRINKFWKPHKWIPAARAMARMQKELAMRGAEATGCLATTNAGPGMTVQYWRSFEHLEAYAHAAESEHMPAWRAFNKAVGDSRGDVGIWHETYLVKAGQYESLYSGMPPSGLGKASTLVPAVGPMSKARDRLNGGEG